MDEFGRWLIGLVLAFALIAGSLIYLGVQWEYRWTSQCVAAGGVAVKLGDDLTCIRGPAQIITIPARPF